MQKIASAWLCPRCQCVIGRSGIPLQRAHERLIEHERKQHPEIYASRRLSLNENSSGVASQSVELPLLSLSERNLHPSASNKVDSLTTCPDCAVPIRNRNLRRHRKRCPSLVKAVKTVSQLVQCPACGAHIREHKLTGHQTERCPKRGTAVATVASSVEPTKSDQELPLVGIPIQKLPFELLPPGSWYADAVEYYQRASCPGGPLAGRQIQWDRLDKLRQLKPQKCYVGKHGWEGYSVFEFTYSVRVVLECPVEGNATYILSGDWKGVIGYSKQYLREHSRQYRARVFHRGDWLSRIDDTLRYRTGL
jgi:hypothetical protein